MLCSLMVHVMTVFYCVAACLGLGLPSAAAAAGMDASLLPYCPLHGAGLCAHGASPLAAGHADAMIVLRCGRLR